MIGPLTLVELPGFEDGAEFGFVVGKRDDDVERPVLGEPDFEDVVALEKGNMTITPEDAWIPEYALTLNMLYAVAENEDGSRVAV